MFVGHLEVGFAAKRAAPQASLGWLLAAPMLLDLLWEPVRLASLAYRLLHNSFSARPAGFAASALLRNTRRATGRAESLGSVPQSGILQQPVASVPSPPAMRL